MGEGLITGRAATAIYLVACKADLRGRTVLVPANICPAAVLPLLYAGCNVAFCDVDSHTGNVTLPHLQAALESRDDVALGLIAHMFGNPVSDLPSMRDMLHERGALLLEDCASAMGATLDNDMPAGSVGDYSVFSFGYSKTIDVGFGGMLQSKHDDMSHFAELLAKLPEYSDEIAREDALLSRLYRQLRNEGSITPFESGLFLGATETMRTTFLHRLDSRREALVREALPSLAAIQRQRKAEQAIYQEVFETAGVNCDVYRFDEGAVPWRFNFMVDASSKRRIVDSMLERAVPVSDWYPNIAPLFADSGSYPGADEIGQRILNLPLMVGEETAREIAGRAIEALRGA